MPQSKPIMLRPPSSNRRQPLLPPPQPYPRKTRLAEVAGGTTAECAVVCCCCPCAIVNLLVLAVYKLPAGLCRRALRRQRRRRLSKKGLLTSSMRRCTGGSAESELQIHPAAALDLSPGKLSEKVDELPEKEAAELEKEMWERFYGTGFWRSPSQRE